MSWRSVKGAAGRLATAEYGDGELAIVLGGGPGLSCDYLLPLGEWLGEMGFRAVCFAYRGVRPSSWPVPSTFRLDDLADDVDAIREAYGSERAHIVAHSFGGYVAWALLARPDEVASLTLVAACAPTREAIVAGHRNLRDRIAGVLGAGRPAAASGTARFLADARAYRHDPTAPLPAALAATTFDADVHAAVMAADHDFAVLPDNAARFEGRATVLVGESDPLGLTVARANVSALARADVRFEVIPAAGHFPWLEVSSQRQFRATLVRGARRLLNPA